MRLYCTEERHEAGGSGTFYLGKAEQLLDALKQEYANQIQLIYLDPPFSTGDTFTMRMKKGRGSVKIPLYTDNMSREEYLSWMRVILNACHALLHPTGSIYVHIDYRMHAQMRLLLDEIFGESNFMNDIVWSYRSGGRSMRYFPRKHDNILFYRKSRKVYFDIKSIGTARGAQRKNHMRRVVEPDGRICFTIRSNGKLYKYYEDTPIYPTDVWTDIEHLQQKDRERCGYATQKPEALLRRIVSASSREGDLVLDLFAGSGTTCAVASKLNRAFIGIDASPASLYTVRERLLSVSSEISLLDHASKQLTMHYPLELCDVQAEISVQKNREQSYALISSIQFEGPDAPIVYAATGVVVGECFHALKTNCSPKMPIKIQLPVVEGAVLQLVNGYGRQAFFSVP